MEREQSLRLGSAGFEIVLYVGKGKGVCLRRR